jgi:hypothetical protein
MSSQLPNCGLYRTGAALPGNEEQVPAGILVYFHNHSDQGPAMLLTPHANEHNRWQFHERGWPVESSDFIAAMVPLKPEGLYVNTEHIHISREEIIPERMLVQLGYNRSGDTILFVGRFEGDTIAFPSQGYAFTTADVQRSLEPPGFNVPRPKAPGDLH